jgi:hypothetical protein
LAVLISFLSFLAVTLAAPLPPPRRVVFRPTLGLLRE